MIKVKDFVELAYTGKLKEDGMVFDTSDEKVAKESGLFEEGREFSPLVVCVGERHVLAGLDDALVGKDTGKFSVDIPVEKAFGKKDAKLIQLIQTMKFKKQGLNPFPGMQVNIDGIVGMVKSVSGGRTIVDFNHPLSGKAVVYDVDVLRVVTDVREQASALLKIVGLSDAKVDVKEKTLTVTVKHPITPQIVEVLQKKMKDVLPVELVNFDVEKPVKPAGDDKNKA